MPHTVEFAPGAARQFRKLPRSLQERLKPAIDDLANDPRPRGCEKLHDDSYRVRVGDYRIRYDVNDEDQVVVVLTVRSRADVYRRMRD